MCFVVLVGHGGDRVLDASSAFNEIPRDNRVDELALLAARQFDEGEGRYYWDYNFAAFGPRELDGYDVFLCWNDLPADFFKDFSVVITECFYAGHVHGLPPVIQVDYRERP